MADHIYEVRYSYRVTGTVTARFDGPVTETDWPTIAAYIEQHHPVVGPVTVEAATPTKED